MNVCRATHSTLPFTPTAIRRPCVVCRPNIVRSALAFRRSAECSARSRALQFTNTTRKSFLKDILGAIFSTPASAPRPVSSFRMAAIPEGAQQATIGGGCFWCIEACFNQLKGVHSCYSGYAGGQVPNPTYEQVCGKKTGHAEVVQITYDPSLITYKDILSVFFTLHDPTTLNRQGNDVGPQYRSIIMYHDEEQKQIAEEVIKEVEDAGIWSGKIVTEVVPLDTFYVGEAYHQRYYENNPNQGYCSFVVGPKVAKFRSKWAARLMN